MFIGCKKNENPVRYYTPQFEEGISGYVQLKYQYLSTTPIHTQTSMLTGYQNKLYRFGSRWPVQVWDLMLNSWSQVPLPDSTYWRWDGSAVTVADSIYVFASDPYISDDIIIFQPKLSSYKHTKVNLPVYFAYPVYAIYKNKIVLVSTKYNNVYEYNMTTSQLTTTAINPFYDVDPWYYPTLAGVKNGSFFFVFGRPGYTGINKLLRLNLDNYVWDSFDLPTSLTNQQQYIGAAVGSDLILMCDSTLAYQYSAMDNKWYKDTSGVPLFPRNLGGTLDQGEWNFFSTDSCLYGTDVYNDKLWKISK